MNFERKSNSRSGKRNTEEIMKPLLDIQTLDAYCRYVISENRNIRASGLNLVKDLFDKVDPSTYNDPERVTRINFIKRGIEARLRKKLNEKPLIIQYINGGVLDKPLLDTESMQEISDETLAYLNEQAAELAKSYFVDDRYEKILALATDLKNSNYTRRSDVVHTIQALTTELNMQFNKMDDAINQDPMFTLIPGEFENSVSDTYARETSPSRTLRTGMIGLDQMLDGGFQCSRVYLLLALAAGGKSFTMLDLAMQIKKYNKDYKPHDPTKIPTIVFLTMENSKDENISRMMGMGTGGKKFSDFTMEESFEALRDNGLGYDPETDPIDIVMIYRPNLSVNTDYMYTLTDKLRESGREPICFFQDHIKRIRPVNKYNDLRLDLGEIVNEFKSFANDMGIPVITDSHLNRDASRTLDDNINKTGENKMDLIRSLGSYNVSESYLMIDNCDAAFIINKEEDSAGLKYLGFKSIKTRTQCDLELFYQPYMVNNPIKLCEDRDSPIPMFKRSLKPENNESGQPIKSKSVQQYNRFGGTNNLDEDDVMFSAENMSSVTATAPILAPDNANQSVFIMTGAPSEPCYMNAPAPIGCTAAIPMVYSQMTEWEKKLEEIKNDSGMKMAISFYNNDGMLIADGLENVQ